MLSFILIFRFSASPHQRFNLAPLLSCLLLLSIPFLSLVIFIWRIHTRGIREHLFAFPRWQAKGFGYSMAGKKIMIVEDENLQLTTLARRLKSAGFEVTAARDGMSAISTARKEQPDLILLDLGLPAGDGFVVLQRLQLLITTSGTPVIVVSSRPTAGNRDQALKAGAIAYFQKPVDFDVLLPAINDALGIVPPNPPTPAPT